MTIRPNAKFFDGAQICALTDHILRE